MNKIILASTSPRRKELIGRLGIPFEIVSSDYEEDMNLDISPLELASHLSEGKATAVAEKFRDDVVIGADTFVVFQGRVLGKPKDANEAKKMLTEFSGNYLSVITGYTIMNAEIGNKFSESVETKVWLRKLSENEIDQYIATGEPLDKAGAFAAQELGSIFVEKIEGDFYTVVGLPLNRVVQKLPSFGIDIWALRQKS